MDANMPTDAPRDRPRDGERNMYGCTPCPQCRNKFRYGRTNGTIECSDCDFIELGAPWHDQPQEKADDPA